MAKSNIDVVVQELRDFKEYSKEKFDKILEQTTKTNGRVTKLEKFNYLLMGAASLLGFMWSVFVGISKFIE